MKDSKYVSKQPDEQGFVAYTPEEDTVWRDLYLRQIEIVKGRACEEYVRGIDLLEMTHDRIPQLPDVNAALNKATGWGVHPVAALIGFKEFFGLLANRRFPAATFIRTREDFDYIKEPDIFHEIFGHCPLLTHPVYAEFMKNYGDIALHSDPKDYVLFARLYWFTVEFGLINTQQGLRVYGGGILSSKNETVYAVESEVPVRKPFDPLEALRTPYRIDILQPIYFVIDDYQQLYDLVKDGGTHLKELIAESRRLGERPPNYPLDHPVDFC